MTPWSWVLVGLLFESFKIVISNILEKMHFALIRVIDQTRMLDQDMIRLQQKVNVVLEYRERQKVIEQAAQQAELEELKAKEKRK